MKSTQVAVKRQRFPARASSQVLGLFILGLGTRQTGKKKLQWPGRTLPLLPFFVSGYLAPLFITCGQTVKLKPISCLHRYLNKQIAQVGLFHQMTTAKIWHCRRAQNSKNWRETCHSYLITIRVEIYGTMVIQ